MKRILAIMAIALLSLPVIAQTGRYKTISTPFSYYVLKADTATGAVYSVKFDLNAESVKETLIVEKKSSNANQAGRYELLKTKNSSSYVIFDTEMGTYSIFKWMPADSNIPAAYQGDSEPVEPSLSPFSVFSGRTDDPGANATVNGIAQSPEEGNTANGHMATTKSAFGQGNAHIKGRTLVGSLPRPSYASMAEGTVVVTVKVDQYGTVVEAIPGADGTNVTDKNLWSAARSAALKAHFNADAKAPAVQTGTITYIFKLK